MKAFMLGWEFPPHISGGLGTACYGMTKGLAEVGVQVCFVLPTAIPVDTTSHVELKSPSDLPAAGRAALGLGGESPAPGSAGERTYEHVEMRTVPALLQPYGDPASHEQAVRELVRRGIIRDGTQVPLLPPDLARAEESAPGEPAPAAMSPPTGSLNVGVGAHYQGDLMSQVHRYARFAVEMARQESFDVVHAHDWMTYPAALAVAAATHKPLVVHVHSTEFDRSGQNVNQQIYDIERTGMHGADKVVCVSHLTRRIVISRYGVNAGRTDVVYNAVDLPDGGQWQLKAIRRNEKIVLFLGRVTMQKGPEYFLRAAKKVVEKYPDVRFVMAGSGDMMAQCVREVADLKMGSFVTFTGFLRGSDVDRVFQMADLYVMPSVSEPFGIAPLEALSHNVPVIISRQSGVSEVLTHVLKVDFWDVDEMANKILAVLRHPPLQRALRQHGRIELRKLSWRDSAERLKTIYADVTSAAG